MMYLFAFAGGTGYRGSFVVSPLFNLRFSVQVLVFHPHAALRNHYNYAKSRSLIYLQMWYSEAYDLNDDNRMSLAKPVIN